MLHKISLKLCSIHHVMLVCCSDKFTANLSSRGNIKHSFPLPATLEALFYTAKILNVNKVNRLVSFFLCAMEVLRLIFGLKNWNSNLTNNSLFNSHGIRRGFVCRFCIEIQIFITCD